MQVATRDFARNLRTQNAKDQPRAIGYSEETKQQQQQRGFPYFAFPLAHPPRSLLAADFPATPLLRSVEAVAAFSLAQPLRMPTETKLGGSVAAGGLEGPLALVLLVLVLLVAVAVEMELSFTMKPPEAAKQETTTAKALFF